MYIKMLVFSVNFNGRPFKYSLYNLTILPALTYDDIIHACIMSMFETAYYRTADYILRSMYCILHTECGIQYAVYSRPTAPQYTVCKFPRMHFAAAVAVKLLKAVLILASVLLIHHFLKF